jgi:hypothetical protein
MTKLPINEHGCIEFCPGPFKSQCAWWHYAFICISECEHYEGREAMQILCGFENPQVVKDK